MLPYLFYTGGTSVSDYTIPSDTLKQWIYGYDKSNATGYLPVKDGQISADLFLDIAMGFFAYYFYFVLSFDVTNLYVQVCKLFIDLQVIFRYFPWWIIAFVCWLLFDRWRKNIAQNRLRHFEARNCGFINELPIVSMACGSMGKKKTTLITDMVLSQEVMFRQKALSILQQNDMKFPYFPWIAFEDELRRCMEHGTVYNLASVKAWVVLKRSRFMRHRNAHILVHYS